MQQDSTPATDSTSRDGSAFTEGLGPEPPVRAKRGFAVRHADPSHPTTVHFHEHPDGSIQITLETVREGMEPLVTGLRLSPKTFGLLSSAMTAAAHDPAVWQEIPGA